MAKTLADDLFAGQEEPQAGDEITTEVSLAPPAEASTPAEPVAAEATPTPAASPASHGELSTGTPAATPAAAATPALSPFMQKVSELGFVDVKDENDAHERLLQALETSAQEKAAYEQRVKELDQYARYGREYLQQQQDPAFQQFQAQRQPQQQPAEAKQNEWCSIPSIDKDRIAKYRELDPTTQEWKWKDGTPADVRVSAESYAAEVEKWQSDILTNPKETLTKAIESVARELYQKEFQHFQTQQEVQSFAQQVKTQNADWLYAKDPRTQQPLINPADGQPFYSQEGQRVVKFLEHAQQIGISDPREQWNYALALSQFNGGGQQLAAPSAPAAPAATPQQTVQTNQVALLRRAAQSNPGRGGSVPGREEKPRSQNPQQRPGVKLLDQLDRDGVVVG